CALSNSTLPFMSLLFGERTILPSSPFFSSLPLEQATNTIEKTIIKLKISIFNFILISLCKNKGAGQKSHCSHKISSSHFLLYLFIYDFLKYVNNLIKTVSVS